MNGAPIVLNDTCYFIPCKTKEEAVSAARMNLGAKAASYLTDVVFEAGQQPFLVFESEGAYGTDVTPTGSSG